MFAGLTLEQTEWLIAHPVADELAAFIDFDLDALRSSTPPFRRGSEEDRFLDRVTILVLAAHDGRLTDVLFGEFDERVAASATQHEDLELKRKTELADLANAITEFKERAEELNSLSESINNRAAKLGLEADFSPQVGATPAARDGLDDIRKTVEHALGSGPSRRRGRPRADRYRELALRAGQIAHGQGIPLSLTRDSDGRPNSKFMFFINGLVDAFDLDIGFRTLAEMAVRENNPDLNI